MGSGLNRLNNISSDTFSAVMRLCCASDSYASLMLVERPFVDETVLYSASDRICASPNKCEWIGAISAHAEIGQKKEKERKWRKQEQAEGAKSSDTTLDRIRALSRQYFD